MKQEINKASEKYNDNAELRASQDSTSEGAKGTLTSASCPGPRHDIFGWFDSPEQTTPAHDPGPSALCVICNFPVERHSMDNPLVTVSLAVYDKRFREKSYFFRAHKNCWNNISEHEQSCVESSLIDKIFTSTR